MILLKKTLLFAMLGIAAGVAGYEVYRRRIQRVEDPFAQEANAHLFADYASRPVKANDAGQTPREEDLEADGALQSADAEAGNEKSKRPRKTEPKKG